MAKNAVNKTFPRPTATGDWNSRPVIEGAVLWSEYDAESTGEIAVGDVVILDTDGVVVGMLEINGTLLVTNDYPDVSLTAGAIHVEDGGEFSDGGTPFTGRLRVELNGAEPSSPLTNTGHERSIMVHGTGKLKLSPPSPTPWRRLAASAVATAVNLTLASAVTNWAAADTVMVTPTGYYGEDAVDIKVLDSAVSTTAVELTTGLSSDRWGGKQYLIDDDSDPLIPYIWSLTPGTFTPPGASEAGDHKTELEESAVVANLTRGVTISGANDSAWTTNKFGAHVMIMSRLSDVVLDGVEFLRCGQMGHMGRYPLHWHMLSYDSSTNGSEDTDVLAASIATARTLTIPALTTLVFLEAYPGSNLRYTTDGSTPTASTGTQIVAGKKSRPITSWTSIKVIQESSGGAVKASYNKGDGSYLGDIPSGKGVVRNCVFRDCSQRGIVIHGTCGVVAEDNILYDIFGHGIFLEDGSERRNTIKRNLIVGIKMMPDGNLSTGFPKRLMEHEGVINSQGAAGLWLTNADNDVGGGTDEEDDNVVIASAGNGHWLSTPLTCMGLSALVTDFRPNRCTIDTLSGYNFGNARHGALIQFKPHDSIYNEEVFNTIYAPTDDDTDSGTEVRFTPRFTNIKNQNGYGNQAMWPNYRRWLTVDNFTYSFSGSTGQGVGPIDPDTGMDRAVIHLSVLGGETLNVTSSPSGWGTKTQVGQASYHGTLVPIDTVFINLPMRAGLPSGAIRINDFYLRGQELFFVLATGNVLSNSNWGRVSLPENLTDTYPYRNMSTSIWDPHGMWENGAKYWMPDDPFFTYDALNLVDCPVPDPTAAGGNGVLVDNPSYGLFFSDLDGDNYLGGAIKPSTFTRYNNSYVSQGEWYVNDVVNAASGSLNWVFYSVPKGNSHICKSRIDIDDYGPLTTSCTLGITNLNTTSDSFLIQIPFATLPSTRTLVVTAFPGTIVTLSVLADLATLEASSVSACWYDSGGDVLHVKFVGGMQDGLEWGDDRDITRPLTFTLAA